MRIIEKLYKGQQPLYPLEKLCDIESALFFDIETTGLKKETTSLYLIGCGHYTDEGFMTKLFFGDSCSEERKLLEAFSVYIRNFSTLLHFNGTKFDVPYIMYKAQLYDIPGIFDGISQIDIYKMCAPLRYLLFPDSMRQKMIENFLCIKRDDKYNGGELIDVYKTYEKTGSDEYLDLLTTHNREDVLGMHSMLPILYYLDLKDAPLTYCGYRINRFRDLAGNECEEVFFDYKTDVYFPRSFLAKTETMYLKASADNGTITIRLPLYRCEMKIFFEDYRDYCYLPDEDRAIHKSIAYSLPKDRYKKATRETCYQKVAGSFIKQPCDIFHPVLHSAYKDKKKYFRFPEDFKEEAAEDFGRSLINIFFTMKRR